MASTWVVLCEIDGSLMLSCGEDATEADRMARAALTAPESVRAAAAGVIALDHTLRTAQVLSYKRAGKEVVSFEAEKEKPAPNPAAYDVVCSFGHDIEKELIAGIQPPPEKVASFVQMLGIPVVFAKRVEPAPQSPTAEIERKEKMRRMAIAGAVVVLLLVSVAFVIIFRSI